MNTLLKYEKNGNLNQHVISCLSGNPAECKSLLNIIPLDPRVEPENDKEVGRSMVETLGTLAIMGILTVAGVAAYNSAMNRYRANTLISEAQKRAVVVAGQIGFNNQTPSLAEFSPPNPTAGGTFGNVTTEGLYKQFGIKVSGVTKSVCQNILNTIGEATPIRRLSLKNTPRTPLTTCHDTNDFLFIYNDDMQGVTSDTEYATDESSCKSVCGVFNPETHLCDESDCEIPTNTCTADDQCNTKNECMVCDTTSGQCKNDCKRVQYLRSEKPLKQYIDVDLDYFADFEVGVKLDSDSENNVTLGVNGQNYFERYSAGLPFWTLRTSGSVFRSTVTVSTYVDSKYKNGIFSLNGTIYGEKNNEFSSGKMTLFGMGSNNPYTMNIYFCKFWDNNGILVRDFIPVKSPKGNCMFDRVTKKLFCNAGSGTFKTDKD